MTVSARRGCGFEASHAAIEIRRDLVDTRIEPVDFLRDTCNTFSNQVHFVSKVFGDDVKVAAGLRSDVVRVPAGFRGDLVRVLAGFRMRCGVLLSHGLQQLP